MTTATADALTWDSFLTWEADRLKSVSDERKRSFQVALTENVQAFRRINWNGIKRGLEQDYKLSPRVEPHWTGPGTALYWQQPIIRERVVGEDNSLTIKEVKQDWQVTGPFPADNPSQINHYLAKGFRLRPPEFGVDVEPFESAVPPEVIQEKQPAFQCKRHIDGLRNFASWKGYAHHCDRFRELPDQKPPPDVQRMVRRATFACPVHWSIHPSRKAAAHHLKISRFGFVHQLGKVTIDGMEVNHVNQGRAASGE